MPSKPSIPKGTRDFSPAEMTRREYIFDTIRKVFRQYGYQPIETPAMENLSSLLGKYGEEGDKLLFRILNSGNFLSGIEDGELGTSEPGKLSARICEKGLRYDLTVPFARYVVQHRDEITFPFKRYQIQPVWRADRPQKGRYREFFQCDVDVIGSNSLLNEYELVRIIDKVFTKLEISVVIKINNRKILAGIAEIAGVEDKITDITIAIDKLEKIGMEAVVGELRSKGIPDMAISRLTPVLELKGTSDEKLDSLESVLSGSATGLSGILEMKKLFGYLASSKIEHPVELDLTLARGLNYYTGAIIEVKAREVSIGSICGGGRYDDLTGIFGMEGVSGVGISFGADRIYDVLLQMGKFSGSGDLHVNVLIVNFGEKELGYNLRLLEMLHDWGVSAEFYPDPAKLKKQLSYADSKKISYVLIAGEEEISKNEVTLKNMTTGEQVKVQISVLESIFR